MTPSFGPRRDLARAVTAVLLMAAAAPGQANAAGAANCSVSATPLAFGRYVPSSAYPSDFTATISLNCTMSGGAPVPVHGTLALAGAAGAASRQLADGARRMRYQVYLDPARTLPWGEGGLQTMSISGVVGPSSPIRQTYTVYGRILARQSEAHVGDYADQITVILNY